MAAPYPQTPADAAAGFALEPNPHWIDVDARDLIEKIDRLEDDLRLHVTQFGRPANYQFALSYNHGLDLAKRTRFLLAQCLFQSNSIIHHHRQAVNQQLAQDYEPLAGRGPDPISWNMSNAAAVHLNAERNVWMAKARELHRELEVQKIRYEVHLARMLARKANMLFGWALENRFLEPGITMDQVQSEGN